MATNPKLSLVLTYLSATLRRPAEVSDDVLGNRVAWAMKFAIEAFSPKVATRVKATLDDADVRDIQDMIDKLKKGESLDEPPLRHP